MKKQFEKKHFSKVVIPLSITVVFLLISVFVYDIISYMYYNHKMNYNKIRYMETLAYHRYIKKQVNNYNNIIAISDYIKRNNFFHDEINSFDLAVSIVKESSNKNLDPFLVLAIIEVESNFDHNSRSTMDARGLMQLRNPTALYISKMENIEISSSNLKTDPILNIKLGIAYLRYLIDKFDGNYKYALIAYNLGINKVYSLMSANINLPKSYYYKVISSYKKINNIYKHQELKQIQETP
ncbi:MAG: lytic transglycosylase domain-containing protein [Calditerrivibrio sp.]|nr:lytic transglycosylase domain-containing protein [Calditerrivibrio sp.]MCA1980068.1 lytic transglycosylase domain-containing protein [Calditerrivibrio sp.]